MSRVKKRVGKIGTSGTRQGLSDMEEERNWRFLGTGRANRKVKKAD
jgi:hypothetical protein